MFENDDFAGLGTFGEEDKMDKVISIIIPVYNVEKYLRKCVDSVLAQTYTNLEVILVDDGSPDNCPGICDEYAVKDSRVKVIHQKNAGVSAARNAGLDAVTGGYIGFVDSDDWIEPDMYETMYNALTENGSDIACIRMSVERETDKKKVIGKPETPKVYEKERALQTMLNNKNITCMVCSYLFSSSLCADLRFSQELCVAEDFLFATELLLRVNKAVFILYACYHYLQRESSAYHSINEKFWTSMTAYDRIFGVVAEHAPYAKKAAMFNIVNSDLRHVVFALNANALNEERYRQLKVHILRYCSFGTFFKLSIIKKAVFILFFAGRVPFISCFKAWRTIKGKILHK